MTPEGPPAGTPVNLRICVYCASSRSCDPEYHRGAHRLGIYLNPIILVNMRGFYDPLLALLDRCIRERFMDRQHEAMWTVVTDVEEVIPAILHAPRWSKEARNFAVI